MLNVGENSPAQTAGFRRFDVITELNGKAVRSAADAQALVDASPNHDPNPVLKQARPRPTPTTTRMARRLLGDRVGVAATASRADNE